MGRLAGGSRWRRERWGIGWRRRSASRRDPQHGLKAVEGELDQGGGVVWRAKDVDDETFPATARVGLWSKADARSYFDDLTVVDE